MVVSVLSADRLTVRNLQAELLWFDVSELDVVQRVGIGERAIIGPADHAVSARTAGWIVEEGENQLVVFGDRHRPGEAGLQGDVILGKRMRLDRLNDLLGSVFCLHNSKLSGYQIGSSVTAMESLL